MQEAFSAYDPKMTSDSPAEYSSRRGIKKMTYGDRLKFLTRIHAEKRRLFTKCNPSLSSDERDAAWTDVARWCAEEGLPCGKLSGQRLRDSTYQNCRQATMVRECNNVASDSL